MRFDVSQLSRLITKCIGQLHGGIGCSNALNASTKVKFDLGPLDAFFFSPSLSPFPLHNSNTKFTAQWVS